MKIGFPPIINQGAKVLILGSAPGEVSLRKQQYYGNNGNQFWKILFDYFNTPLTADYTEKKQFLLEHHVGLWDVYDAFEREGSSDNLITEYVLNDFTDILTNNSLKLIIANGKKAHSEIIKNHLFNQLPVTYCISTSGAANNYMDLRKKQWTDALDSVFKTSSA
ncbi:DNA-deoxyinosine glycosylase [Vagococcus vulneris]|uniref:DNA-deoxyinosine glycosylase n=1 Tax=Vagococcus vulneris TaxID=1977869 RepID=A0A429ZZE1_9ENTE|nr:DNA-deoxyinosine glycosylase [Vagococcus vulneris]RST99382.1 DNA-deoxyinosine glycosylase [Vagococcus vulneris]